MKIMYIGSYEKNYPRNAILIEGIQRNGHTVLSTHVNKISLNVKSRIMTSLFLIALLPSFVARSVLILTLGIYSSLKKHPDFYIVGFPGLLDIPIVWIIATIFKKPLVYDGMISFYDSIVIDRGILAPSSFLGKILLKLEKILLSMPTFVMVDTVIHGKYLRKLLNLSSSQLIVVPIGADDRIYKRVQRKSPTTTYEVLFFGSFIPLHGIDTIIEAAKLLKRNRKIKFTLVGDGQMFSYFKDKVSQLGLSNIKFAGFMLQSKFVSLSRKADVFLGVFSSNNKTDRAVPNKIYQGLALGLPVVTAATTAVKGEFKNLNDIVMINPNDPQSLVEAILLLRNDKLLSTKVSVNGYRKYKSEYAPEKVSQFLLQKLAL